MKKKRAKLAFCFQDEPVLVLPFTSMAEKEDD
jgi:hypothetical protein